MVERKEQRMILASASPRRKKLLTEAGYKFRVAPSHVDESAFACRGDTDEYVRILALAKANDVAKWYPNHLVIGADTIVDFNGEIIGKPIDARDAERITRKLFSAPHRVITGMAIVRINDAVEIVDSDTTIVYPKKLTEEQIAGHLRGNLWKGKAGAYGIQETGDEFVERIEGSFTNVMGMPMELFERMLERVP
jgi:septum formation protein